MQGSASAERGMTCSRGTQVGFERREAAARTRPLHGVDALPAELPERPHVYYLMNKNSFPARVVVCCLQPQLVSEGVLGAPFVSTDI